MKKTFLILGGLALAFTALVGIAFGANQALEKTTTSTHVIAQPVRAVVIDLDVGDVELVRAGDTVRVQETLEYAVHKPTLHRSVENGVLTLKGDCGGSWFFNCGTNLRVDVPAGVPVRTRSNVGSVKAIALDSPDVRVQNDVGDIRLDLTGDLVHLEARSNVGDIDIAVPDTAYAIDTSTDVGDDDVHGVVQDDHARRTITATSDVGDVSVLGR
jgi:hypothetical protein